MYFCPYIERMVEEEEAVGGAELWARDYLNESNPSVLRYLIAAREARPARQCPPPHRLLSSTAPYDEANHEFQIIHC
jgi:hypothetical protein